MDLHNLPESPGIYIYRNQDNEIIYVGKAVNLKRRVSQYFQSRDALGPKTTSLVSQIASIETKTVDSEIQALILEASLIKKHKPKFNSLLKDDRSYLYICITREVLPRVFTCRFSELNKTDHYYGPFPNGSAVRSLLKTLRRIFPYISQKVHSQKLCLYCHLGMCPGPNPDPQSYRQSIGKLKRFLSGNINSLQKQIRKEMNVASKTENFELAQQYKHELESINYVIEGWNTLSHFYQQVDLPEDVQSSAINELMTTLKPYLNVTSLQRIECFDISQMVSRHFVGSMTVYQNGHISPDQYRQFKINSKVTPDDQFMIKEVVYRRLQHPEWGAPDLIVVDGGKPQVSAVTSITSHSVIGLAKRIETIVIKDGSKWVEINLPSNSTALRLLQSLRDEAHRFANRYRKKLMSKSIND